MRTELNLFVPSSLVLRSLVTLYLRTCLQFSPYQFSNRITSASALVFWLHLALKVNWTVLNNMLRFLNSISTVILVSLKEIEMVYIRCLQPSAHEHLSALLGRFSALIMRVKSMLTSTNAQGSH